MDEVQGLFFGRMIRFYRRRIGGNIIRAHDDHINRGELIQHAELVRRGALPREGSLATEFPPYDTIEELEKELPLAEISDLNREISEPYSYHHTPDPSAA